MPWLPFARSTLGLARFLVGEAEAIAGARTGDGLQTPIWKSHGEAKGA